MSITSPACCLPSHPVSEILLTQRDSVSSPPSQTASTTVKRERLGSWERAADGPGQAEKLPLTLAQKYRPFRVDRALRLPWKPAYGGHGMVVMTYRVTSTRSFGSPCR